MGPVAGRSNTRRRGPSIGLGRRRFLGALSGVAIAGLTNPGRAIADEPTFVGVSIERLVSGEIVTDRVRLSDGLVAGRAVGLVDGTLSELIRVAVDFPRYGRILPLDEVRVAERSHGYARLDTRGSYGRLGRFEATLDVRVVGRSDGRHLLEIRGRSSSFDTLFARMDLRRSPGGVRSIVAVDVGLRRDDLAPASRLARASRGLATSTVARIRSVIHESHALGSP